MCIPSFATLLPADRANWLFLNVRDAECEYHDPVTQRVKMGCTDDSCTNCKGEYRFLQHRRHMPGEDESVLVRFECKAKVQGAGSSLREFAFWVWARFLTVPWKQMLSAYVHLHLYLQ